MCYRIFTENYEGDAIVKYLLPDKKQYKINLHAHTVISDGMLSASEIKSLYKSNGYSAVAFTDHDILIRHNELTDGEFVALNGYEYKINENGAKHAENRLKTFHINMIAKSPDIDYQVCFNPYNITTEAERYIPFAKYRGGFYDYDFSASGVNEVADIAHRNGFLVHYNHPVWCMNDFVLNDIYGFDGVETINTNSCVIKDLPEDTDVIYERFLREERRPYPLACDDNHNQRGTADSLKSFNMVALDVLSYENIISALESGDTYASSGPIIKSLTAQDGNVYIVVENTVHISMRTEGRRAKTVYDKSGVDRAVFHIREDDGYVRFVLTDKEGNHAYTRAYEVREIL